MGALETAVSKELAGSCTVLYSISLSAPRCGCVPRQRCDAAVATEDVCLEEFGRQTQSLRQEQYVLNVCGDEFSARHLLWYKPSSPVRSVLGTTETLHGVKCQPFPMPKPGGKRPAKGEPARPSL